MEACMVNHDENIESMTIQGNNNGEKNINDENKSEKQENTQVKNISKTEYIGLTTEETNILLQGVPQSESLPKAIQSDKAKPNEPQPSNKADRERRHKKYKVSINHTELKALEGMTVSSFVDLATAVILIDGKQYNKKHLPLSKERKNDFKRYIEHYTIMELIGKRKYHIKRVYSVEQREELNEQQANIQRNNSKK